MNPGLLKHLADGGIHSGSELGALLGISRTAVWKQINSWRALGLQIEARKRQGYCVPGGLELLEEAAIRRSLAQTGGDELLSALHISEVVDSTSEWLRKLAATGAASATVCMAEAQTAGRGRRGRTWHSPFAAGILMSVLWRYERGLGVLEGLSTAVGTIVAETLVGLGVEDIGLKWPNDVYCAGRKLAGVLIDLNGEVNGPCEVLVGIGLNFALPVRDNVIDQPWTDLTQAGFRVMSRNQLAGQLLGGLLPLLHNWQQNGFAAWQQCWQRLDMLAGREVVADWSGQQVVGIAEGVDDSGALILRRGMERLLLHGGEVSLRVA